MADGTSYEIDLLVKSVGAESSAGQLAQLASQLDAANAVSTSFDTALDRTKALLADASAASASAAGALSTASASYGEAERAAIKAAQAVDRANLAERDSSALQANAAAAASALATQTAALDAAKAAASSADAAEAKLAATLKTLEAAAKSEAAAMQSAAKEADNVGTSTGGGAKSAAAGLKSLAQGLKGADLPMGTFMRRASMLTKSLGANGWAGACVLGAAAVLALSAAVLIGVFSLAKMAVEVNKKAMADLAKTSEKANTDFAALFAGVHVEKFTAAMAKVEAMLGQNTSTGRALKQLLTTLLNPLFDAIPKVLPLVQAFLRGMVLGALEVAIAFVKVYIAARNMIPASWLAAMRAASAHIDWLRTALVAGEVVIGVIGVALAVLTGLLIIFAAAIMIANIPLVLLIALLAVLLVAVLAIPIGIVLAIVYFKQIIAWLGNLGSAGLDAASSLISGLVDGIMSGVGAVVAAIKSMAGSAVTALMSALQAHSPSVLFSAIGETGIAGGVKRGVERGASGVNAAVGRMVEPPDMPRGGAAGAAGSSTVSTGGNTYNVTIVAPSGDATAIRDVLDEWYATTISGLALQAGGAPA